MRVLVLGGTRFIGPPAVRQLVEMSHEVTVFHRGQTDARLPEQVRHLHGDRERLSDFAEDIRRFAPDVVLDMVPATEHDGKTLISLFQGIARRLVAISSGDVYRAYDRLRRKDPGPPDPTPLTEDSPLRERLFPYEDVTPGPEKAPHTYEKILMERAVMSAPDTLPATILRLPMVYGPGDYQHRLLSYLKRMDDQRPFIVLAEDQAAHRALRGYVEDIGQAIALCVTKEEAAGHTYHVADKENVTEAEWVERIATAAGWGGDIITLPSDQMPEHLKHPYDMSQHWSLDSSRIRQELGYSEVVPPEEAMRRALAWERANPPQELDAAWFNYAAEDAAVAARPGR